MKSHLSLRKPVAYLAILFQITIITILVGCSSAATEATRQVSINNVQVSMSTPTQPYAFKTSDPGYVTIRGTLVVLDPMSIVPAQDNGIYLVPLPADQGISTIPQFEVGKVPQADVDEMSGEFVFTNINPGQYAVVVLTAGGSQYPVRKQDSGNYAIFTVNESQKDTTVDLGHLTLP